MNPPNPHLEVQNAIKRSITHLAKFWGYKEDKIIILCLLYMDKILLKWLKFRFLNCKIDTKETLIHMLNKEAENMCTFVSDETLEPNTWGIKMYDESNFIKYYKFIYNDNHIIIDIT